jgi:cyclic dehypoxanthinyl futalosine synthase
LKLYKLYTSALNLIPLNTDEGVFLYENAPLEELMFVAGRLRQIHNPGKYAGWMIDRNVNITNICFSQCSFCNFCRKMGSPDAYVTSIDDYRKKIDELITLGGDQLRFRGHES